MQQNSQFFWFYLFQSQLFISMWTGNAVAYSIYSYWPSYYSTVYSTLCIAAVNFLNEYENAC